MKNREDRADFSIRRGNREDAKELRELVNQAFSEYRKGKNNPHLEEDLDDIIRDIAENEVLILEKGNKIAGSLRLENRSGNKYLLKRFAIHPHFQGQGLGKYLYEEAEKRVKAGAGNSIYLYSSTEDEKLVQYYTGLGFKCIEIDKSMGYARGLWVKKLY